MHVCTCARMWMCTCVRAWHSSTKRASGCNPRVVSQDPAPSSLCVSYYLEMLIHSLIFPLSFPSQLALIWVYVCTHQGSSVARPKAEVACKSFVFQKSSPLGELRGCEGMVSHYGKKNGWEQGRDFPKIRKSDFSALGQGRRGRDRERQTHRHSHTHREGERHERFGPK